MGVTFHLQNFIWWRNFPSGPVVRGLHFQCQGHGFDPGQETKIPHTTWQKKKPLSLMVLTRSKGLQQLKLHSNERYNEEDWLYHKDSLSLISVILSPEFLYRVISLEYKELIMLEAASFLFFLAKLSGMQQDPGSLTRSQTHSVCSGRAESQPLDPQGSPLYFLF